MIFRTDLYPKLETMKNNFLIFIFSLFIYSLNAQITPSSCTASDSVESAYSEDAQRLALKKILRQNLNFKDSVIIPQNHIDTVFNALIAVYNASTLPARDTVVGMFDIHTFRDLVMNRLIVIADSSLPWMQQLKGGNTATGNVIVDSLISKYNLTNYTYSGWSNDEDMVLFVTDTNYNLLPLINIFSALPQVSSSFTDFYIGDGNYIKDSIYSDHVELIYRHGWTGCPAGCLKQRFWKFKVYFDCSVEYVESYGTPLEFLKVNENDAEKVSVYPNPFSSQISVKGINGPFDFTITTLLGQKIMDNRSNNGLIEKLELLDESIYFLTIKTEEFSKTFKMYRNR